MNGFGFIEYDDALDARDVVPGKLSSPNTNVSFSWHLLTSRYIAFRTFPSFLLLSKEWYSNIFILEKMDLI
jgi:hypothetical protein